MCPGMRGIVPRYLNIRYRGFDQFGNTSTAKFRAFTRAWFSTSAIISMACSTRSEFATCGSLVLSTRFNENGILMRQPCDDEG